MIPTKQHRIKKWLLIDQSEPRRSCEIIGRMNCFWRNNIHQWEFKLNKLKSSKQTNKDDENNLIHFMNNIQNNHPFNCVQYWMMFHDFIPFSNWNKHFHFIKQDELMILYQINWMNWWNYHIPINHLWVFPWWNWMKEINDDNWRIQSMFSILIWDEYFKE